MVEIIYIPSMSDSRLLSPKPLSPYSAMDHRHRSSRDSQSTPLRRASTAPISSPATTSFGPGVAVATDTEGTVETLYNHPSARIVAFNNYESTGRFRPETLVPSGRVDRTLAVGS